MKWASKCHMAGNSEKEGLADMLPVSTVNTQFWLGFGYQLYLGSFNQTVLLIKIQTLGAGDLDPWIIELAVQVEGTKFVSQHPQKKLG